MKQDVFSRRHLLLGAATGLTSAALLKIPASIASDGDEWHRSERLPDPAIKSLDPAFDECINSLSTVERLGTGMEWCEGPTWMGGAERFIFSDVRGNRIMQWDPVTHEMSVFRRSSNFSNGNTVDRQGRLLTCEGETRRVTRTEHDGTISVIMDSHDGKPLNSPNDIICKSDGTIWFTDPRFGPNFSEGVFTPPQLPANVYRVNPSTGRKDVILNDVPGPNGLAFSPDEKILYVVASRAKPSRQLWAYDVSPSGALSNKRVFFDCGAGAADGIKTDMLGNVWCGWGSGPALDGVMVLSPAAKPIGHIGLPERCPNLTFGGPYRNELFMTAHSSIYKLTLKVQGSVLTD